MHGGQLLKTEVLFPAMTTITMVATGPVFTRPSMKDLVSRTLALKYGVLEKSTKMNLKQKVFLESGLTMVDAAKTLGVSRRQIYNLIDAKKIKTFDFKGRKKIKIEENSKSNLQFGRGGFQMLRIMSAKKPITDKIKDVPLEDRLAHIVNDDNTISKIPIESLESVTVREEKKKKAEKIEEELASHKENIRNKNNYKF